jgi:branched-chain amino acid transport system ATP-binding protein
MSEAILSVEALEAGYGEVQVLWGISLGAAQGRLTTIVGANGVGKTTSVEENLEMGAYSRHGASSYASRLERVFELFPRLKERRHQRAGTFSGGEQQMLAIARGLMSDPDLIVIDELSLGLAPVIVHQIFTTLKQLKESGLSILLVEQNVHLAFAISDYAYVIAEGRVFTEGEPVRLEKMPEIRQAYLGL